MRPPTLLLWWLLLLVIVSVHVAARPVVVVVAQRELLLRDGAERGQLLQEGLVLGAVVLVLRSERGPEGPTHQSSSRTVVVRC